jgi:hypothetical protein
MQNSTDSEEAITKEILDTLERSKALRDKNAAGHVTAEHFHSYEYLLSLLARRQALTNETLERLTRDIKILTWVVVGLTLVTVIRLFI